MSQHETGVECPFCKGAIVAEVTSNTTLSSSIPIGPASQHYRYRLKVVSFHCSMCQIVFYHPPGQPDAASKILQKIHRESNDKY